MNRGVFSQIYGFEGTNVQICNSNIWCLNFAKIILINHHRKGSVPYKLQIHPPTHYLKFLLFVFKRDQLDWPIILIWSNPGLTVDIFIVKCWPFHWLAWLLTSLHFIGAQMLTVSLHIWPTAAPWLEDTPAQAWQAGWVALRYIWKRDRAAPHCKLIYLKKG